MTTTPEATRGVPKIVGDPSPTMRSDFNALADRLVAAIDPAVASVPALPSTGNWPDRKIRVSATGIIYKWNGSAWRAWESDWLAFTIAPVSGFALGTGSVTNVGKYRYEAGMVRCHFYLVLGTTGSSVTGVPTMNLPVTSAAQDTLQPAFMGDATFYDTSANGAYFCKPVPQTGGSTSQFRLVIPGTNGIFTGSSPTVPFTWAPGDAMQGEFVYIPA